MYFRQWSQRGPRRQMELHLGGGLDCLGRLISKPPKILSENAVGTFVGTLSESTHNFGST